MFKYIPIFIFLFFGNTGNSQDSPIQLDRPDQTESPFIVQRGYLQSENGIGLEKYNKVLNTFQLPTVLWKYGMHERFEWRLITEVNYLHSVGIYKTGLLPFTFGFKTNISHAKGLLPEISFIAHVSSAKSFSKEFQTNFLAPSFRFTIQHNISKLYSLSYNLGAEWDGFSPEPYYLYTLSNGFSLSQNSGMYFEIFGYVKQKNIPDHRFDCGFTYLINNNFILDLSGGIGLSSPSPKYYFSFGLSYRVKLLN